MIVYIVEPNDYDSWIEGVFTTREAAEAYAPKGFFLVTAYRVAESAEQQRAIRELEQLEGAEERNPGRSKKRTARLADLRAELGE